MTEKTRARLGTHFLTALLAYSLVWTIGAFAATPVEFSTGVTRQEAAMDFAKLHGVGPATAEQFLARVEREQKVKVIEKYKVSENARLDFINVRSGAMGKKNEVEYLGSGFLASKESALGQRFLFAEERSRTILQRISAFFIGLFHPRDWVLVPLGFVDPTQKPNARSQAAVEKLRAAPTVKIAVVMAEFPPWEDVSPQNLDDPATRGVEGGGDQYYEINGGPQGGRWTGLVDYTVQAHYAMAGNDECAGAGNASAWVPDAYADSAGGRMVDGYPMGMQYGWVQLHNGRGPTWERYTTEWNRVANRSYTTNADFTTPSAMFADWQLQDYWWNFFFNRSNANCVTNYFYDNTHGHKAVEGDRSSVMGWLRTHNVLDRYPAGGARNYAVQPGTPIIRPLPASTPQGILRASFSGNELTIVFNQDVSSVGLVTLNARQLDANSGTSGN